MHVAEWENSQLKYALLAGLDLCSNTEIDKADH
nr:MAG TPA: hypothetical protein [Caudoviricetes sp.]